MMPKASAYSSQMGRERPSGAVVDRYALVSITAFAYALIASPLLILMTTTYGSGKSIEGNLQNLMTPHPANKFFWPILAAVAVGFVVLNWSRLTLPPNI